MKETQDKPGFSVDDIGLEPTTPTMSTCKHTIENAGKLLGNRESSERLHQCLHQIAKLIEQNQLDTLVDVLAESLEPNDLKRLAFIVNNRLRRS